MFNNYCVFGLSFIFLMTTCGALCVFLCNDKILSVNDLIMGFSSGVMLASCIWSLIIPCVESSYSLGIPSFIPLIFGLFFGSLIICIFDIFIQKNRQKSELSKVNRFFLAVTLHNIPEGLAVGIAFGSALSSNFSAISLAIGIGLQNFPEGLAVALPTYKIFKSKPKGFLYGFLSGVVEPIFGVIGFYLAFYIATLQPWILGISAGCMLFVTASELMPETAKTKRGIWLFMVGFAIMSVLDIA